MTDLQPVPTLASLTVEHWPVTRLIPYAANPRRISDSAVSKVMGSLHAFGWRQPIVVDREGVIVVGHTRLLAAQRLGYETVPVHVATDLTPAQARAYRIADNRVGDESTWDDELLTVELSDLKDLGQDLGLTGFDAGELESLLGTLVPDLDALEDEHGAHAEASFWPEIRVRVPPETKHLFDRLMATFEGDEATRFLSLLQTVQNSEIDDAA